MTGPTTATITALRCTFRADGIEARFYPAQVRATIWAMAQRTGVALPPALFHHDSHERTADGKPTILWQPARGGVAIAAIGPAAQNLLITAVEPILTAMTRATDQRVTLSIDPPEEVGAFPTDHAVRYLVRNMVVSRRLQRLEALQAMDADARSRWLEQSITHHLQLQAEAWGVPLPDLTGLSVKSHSSDMPHGAQVTRGAGRHGKTIIGTFIPRIAFTARCRLIGPWAVGHATSKGYGGIIDARTTRGVQS